MSGVSSSWIVTETVGTVRLPSPYGVAGSLLLTACAIEAVRVPSARALSSARTVTVCGVFQVLLSKASAVGSALRPGSDGVTDTVTLSPTKGCDASRTV